MRLEYKALRKCNDAVVKGARPGPCPDARASARLGTATSKLRAAIEKAVRMGLVSSMVTPRVAFERDLLITNHWLPRGATVAWVLAWVFAIVATCYDLVERRGMALRPLVLFGRAALFLYLAHHVIVVTLVQRTFGVSLRSWPLYWVAVAALLALLVPLAAGWTRLTRARRTAARAPADLSAAA